MNFNDRKARFFARTMHTPDDEARAAIRAALRETSRALLPLHRALIEAARSDYSFAYEPVEQPTQLLRLLHDHPFFEWLKPLTSLIVDIDEISRRDFESEEIAAIAARLESMFGNGADQSFTSRYVPILQRETEVAIAHAAVRKAASRLR
jgi:hypothetical protein